MPTSSLPWFWIISSHSYLIYSIFFFNSNTPLSLSHLITLSLDITYPIEIKLDWNIQLDCDKIIFFCKFQVCASWIKWCVVNRIFLEIGRIKLPSLANYNWRLEVMWLIKQYLWNLNFKNQKIMHLFWYKVKTDIKLSFFFGMILMLEYNGKTL